jgi:AraC-like DNA-binding protein
MGTIRTEWLARLDASVERLTDDLTTIDVRTSRHLLQHFVDTLDTPPDALHGAVLSTVLMDACGRVVQILHDQNPPAGCDCEKAIWAHVSRVPQWRDADPRPAFRHWLLVFFDTLEQRHPSDVAVRAAQALRREPQRAWTLVALAATVDTRPAALSREFQARYGMRPAAYLHLARATRAVAMLRTPATVETIARDVGYRSKKDLYAALNRWAERTPGELRSLPAEQSHGLERALKQQCLRGAAARPWRPRRGARFRSVRSAPLLGGSNRRRTDAAATPDNRFSAVSGADGRGRSGTPASRR